MSKLTTFGWDQFLFPCTVAGKSIHTPELSYIFSLYKHEREYISLEFSVKVVKWK